MKLSKFIDHTILKAFAAEADIIKLCEQAKENDFMSVCINPYNVTLAKKLLAGTGIKVCTVIGFPLGANKTAVKAYETKLAYEDGCDEFDMVINVGALKDKKYDYVRDDIKAVIKEAKGKTTKIIIETLFLTEEEKIMVCKLSAEVGADFVKTCTGFNEGIATVEDVKLMRANISKNMKVKASAGIRTYEQAQALIDAGAERLGTSAGAVIISGKK